MTRRSLFARLLGALAAVPLVGKCLSGGSQIRIESIDYKSKTVWLTNEEPFDVDFMPGSGMPLNLSKFPVVERTREELEAKYPAIRQWNSVADRNSKHYQDGMDRFFHEE